jgi:hypothetical protein
MIWRIEAEKTCFRTTLIFLFVCLLAGVGWIGLSIHRLAARDSQVVVNIPEINAKALQELKEVRQAAGLESPHILVVPDVPEARKRRN